MPKKKTEAERPDVPRVALTINETCIATGLCRKTIYDHIREKLLIARKIGSRTVVLMEDLNDYLRSFPTVDRATEQDPIRRRQPTPPSAPGASQTDHRAGKPAR